MSLSLTKISGLLLAFIFGALLFVLTNANAGGGGLVASYGFDEGYGTNIADSSGYNNNGTLSSGVTYNSYGKYGASLTFNGTGFASIADSDSLDLSNGMTLEAWVSPTKIESWTNIAIKEKDNGLAYALYAGTETNLPSGEVHTDGSSKDARGLATLPLNTWTHVAVTYDGTVLKFYKNGVLESEKNVTGTISQTSNPFRIGGNSIWGEYFSGRIDEVRIYNRALSVEEIVADKDTPISGASPTPTGSAPTPTGSVPTPTGAIDARATTGEWSQTSTWPIVSVHSTLLPNGKVLLWDGWEVESNTRVWDPNANTFTERVVQSGLFCSGHSLLVDGRVLTAGGWESSNGDGIVDANIFDSTTTAWTSVADMHLKRWYPTTTELSNGKVLALSGMIDSYTWANNPEVYDPKTNSWELLEDIDTSSMKDLEYPYIFKRPDGSMYVVSPYQGTLHKLDLQNSSWTDLGDSPIQYGSLVQYAPGKILMSGGGQEYGQASQTNTSVIDLNQSSSWRTVEAMAHPRYQHNLVALPDGKILAVGGSRTTYLGANDGVLEAEIWDPSTEDWSTVASMNESRNYHSVVMLMPDGRVLAAGGGRYGGANDMQTAQIYSPGYLFKGDRPVISNAPTLAAYSSSINVNSDQANNINKVVLISLPSVTHTVDMNQHYLDLQFTKNGNSLSINTPTNPNLAPPGYYMLFIVNQYGVPSVSKILKLDGQPSTSPTPTVAPPVTPTPTIAPTSTPTPTPTASPTPTPLPGQNLMASYNFEEGSGTTVIDKSGNYHTGTITGAATYVTAGKNGKAISFPGASYISINDTNKLDLTTNFTLSAWIKPTSLSGWRTLILKDAVDHHTYALYANTHLNTPTAEINTGTLVYDTQGISKIPLNTWTHIAMSYNGSTLRLYINGVQVSSRVVSIAAQASNGKLYIGGNLIWGEYFKGQMDDVRIYNKALNLNEITSDMNSAVQ